jgi:PleD family two-component response regulator
VCTFPWDASDEESFIKGADQNLYRAKELGRNQVVTSEQPAPA